MARTVIGWENFELLCNSTGGILIKYIGNIFTATKADVSQERDSFGGAKVTMPGSQVSQHSPSCASQCHSLCLSLAAGCSQGWVYSAVQLARAAAWAETGAASSQSCLRKGALQWGHKRPFQQILQKLRYFGNFCGS